MKGPSRRFGLVLASAWLACASGGCKQDEPERVLQAYPDNYGGVGLELATGKDYPSVRRVFEGTPAAMGGLLVGDVLLQIDGIDLRGRNLADVVAGLRGEIGTRVVVTLRRGAGGKELVPLVRRAVARGAARDYAPTR